jgi:branched-chain amino acid transport system ATP-binding protein
VSSILSVEDLEVRYGHLAAVRGISFDIEEGELVALVGPNGAGKTTTLSALAGVLGPAKGTICFRDEAINGIQPEELVRRGIALVPEGRHIFGSLTVQENLESGASARRGRTEIRDDIDRVLGIFPRLLDFLPRSAGKLSGGEQQQLAIGRALVSRPKLLMLDEPSLGLAPLIVQRVFETISDLRREQGVTILLVEQNARAATQLADRTYVMRQGRIELSGSREQLAHDERFQEAFLGFS